MQTASGAMMNRLALGLIAGLAAFAPALAEEGTMTDAERAALRAEIRAYLLENPEVLVEAMNALQVREDEAAMQRDLLLVSSESDAIFLNPNDWVGGNPEGDITLVEFMDYRCSYCRKAYTDVSELVETDGNIRFVVKEFPILGEASMMSSQFAIAVRLLHGDAAYEAAHDALITLRGEPSPETLSRLATDLGLDPQPVLERMGGADVQKVIADNYALAELMSISGTPAFVMKDLIMRGYAPLEDMRAIVADARQGG
jgi:protein-disulfide isomerase